jgi:hypothetical protein
LVNVSVKKKTFSSKKSAKTINHVLSFPKEDRQQRYSSRILKAMLYFSGSFVSPHLKLEII